MDEPGLLFSTAALGFLLGLRHAADPDHLIAVSTIVSRTRRLGPALLVGAAWGLGHTFTVLLLGGAILLLKLSIPARLGLALEFAVGALLVGLGVLNLAGRDPLSHAHEHAHEDGHDHHPALPDGGAAPHRHPHAHPRALAWLERAAGEAGLPAAARAFAVGLVHGLAGSAAVAFMVLAALPSAQGGLAFLLVFGAGTMAGMASLSALLEAAFLWAERRLRVERWVRAGTGLLSLAFGFYIIYQTGFVDGLFLETARWDPH